MKNDGQRGKKNQLEAHSLPGTNQAGKGPGLREKHDQENGPGGAEPQRQEQLEKHSLPGTNQAGKGPVSRDKRRRPSAGKGRGGE
jgi:hypothetical protein